MQTKVIEKEILLDVCDTSSGLSVSVVVNKTLCQGLDLKHDIRPTYGE